MFEVDVDPGPTVPGAEARPDGRLMLRCLPDGCPNLLDQVAHRCRIYAYRPSACRHFPFRALDTPGGRYIGASFACTAVLTGQGKRIEMADRDWARLPGHDYRSVALIEGQKCDWESYQQIEEYLGDQLCLADGSFSGAIGVSLACRQNSLGQLGKLKLNWLSDDIEAACQRTLRGLLAICEAGDRPERAQEVLVSQVQGGRYASQIFPGWAEPREIQRKMEGEDPDHWSEVEPFFRHLLFRKFLWGPPSVQARVCLLPLINEMLRYWTWQQALVDQQKPSRRHRLEAIREVERRLTFHAQGWEEFLLPLSLAFLKGVG
jgi:Fe-S-cluster containining protein